MNKQKKESKPKRSSVEFACDSIIAAFEDETSDLAPDEIAEVLEYVASEFEDRLEALESNSLLQEINTDDWDLMDDIDLADFDDHDGQ